MDSRLLESQCEAPARIAAPSAARGPALRLRSAGRCLTVEALVGQAVLALDACEEGSKQAMLGVFEDFCPLVQKILHLVPDGEICEWKLRVHEPLPTWTCGSTALIGDACHPTLPHLNQGAAQAIEDAAAIAVALDRCPSSSPEDIAKSLKVYERVRKDRAYLLVDLAAQSGRALHLGDGKAKEERDKAFAAVREGGKVPDKWADADVQKMIYSFDPARETDLHFEDYFRDASVS